jgi:Putative viral replication protein
LGFNAFKTQIYFIWYVYRKMNKNDQIEQKEQNNLGNTNNQVVIKKQGIQTVKWCFTLNNWTLEQKEQLDSWQKIYCKKYIHGEEIGECGTRHLQGAFILKTKNRLSGIKSELKISQIHLEKMHGSWDQSLYYCTKDNTNVFIKIDKPTKEHIDCIHKEQFHNWQNELYEILESKPDDRTIHWYWENKGNTGKTGFTRYLGLHENACIIQKGKYSDIMNHVYNHENMDIFIIDVPRACRNKVSYIAIESIKSGIIFNTKYETGQKFINAPHIIVFANFPPDEEELSADRWHIVNIPENITDVLNNDLEKFDKNENMDLEFKLNNNNIKEC